MNTDSYIRFHYAGDMTVKAGHRLGPRHISDYELVYFPIGTRTVYSLQGREHVLDKPTALVTRPGEWHAYAFDADKPTRHLFVHFDVASPAAVERYPLLGGEAAHSNLIRRSAPFEESEAPVSADSSSSIPSADFGKSAPSDDTGMLIPSDVFALNDYSLVPVLMKQLLYYFHKRPHRWVSLAEMIFLSILEELESAAGEVSGLGQTDEAGMPAQIVNALQYIESRCAENIDVEQLARSAGWSHEHFTRMFQRHVGHAPKEWMIKRKIELAAQYLLQRPDSVKQIARSLGFADEYYFHRLFRRRMGMTATEYRSRYGDSRMRELAPPTDWSRFYPLNHFFMLNAADKE